MDAHSGKRGLPAKTGEDTSAKAGSRAWLVVLMLCLVGTLNYLDRTMVTTMKGAISEAIPMTNAQFGLLTSVFLWVYGVFSPFAGFLADRFKRSRVIVMSLLIWSLITWLTSHVRTFEQLLFTRALMGISEACYYPAALALIADYHRSSTRSLAIGVNEVGVTLGASLGFLGGMIAEHHTWNTPFAVFGLFGVIYALFLLVLLKDPPPAAGTATTGARTGGVGFREAIKQLLKEPAFLRLVAFWGLLGIVGWMVLGWLPVYYRERFQLSEGVAGLYATGYLYPASMAGVLVGGFLADRWSAVYPRARIMVPAIGLAVAAPGIFMASYTDVLVFAVAFFMLYAFTRAFTDSNLMPVLCMVVDDRYRATGYGVLNMFACLIGGAGLYAGGVLRDSAISLSTVFQVASALIIVCALLLSSIRLRKADHGETKAEAPERVTHNL